MEILCNVLQKRRELFTLNIHSAWKRSVGIKSNSIFLIHSFTTQKIKSQQCFLSPLWIADKWSDIFAQGSVTNSISDPLFDFNQLQVWFCKVLRLSAGCWAYLLPALKQTELLSSPCMKKPRAAAAWQPGTSLAIGNLFSPRSSVLSSPCNCLLPPYNTDLYFLLWGYIHI